MNLILFMDLMFSFLMMLQASGCSGNVVTLVTRISYTLMLVFLMALQVPSLCSKVVTLITRVSYTLMLGIYVLLPDC